MLNKKIIIIIVGVVAIITVTSVILLSSKKNNSNVTTPPADQTTSNNGGVTNVSPSPTSDGRFVVKEDPTQPFVSISPRANEPLPVTSQPGGADFTDYDKAVADGLIKDKNGMYHQNPVGDFNPAQKFSDSSLSSTDFLAKYYGSDVQNTINNTSTFDGTLSGGDPIVVLPTASTSNTIDLVAGFDNTSLKTSSDNSTAAIKDYISQLSALTAKFDLVNNSLNTISVIQTVSDSTVLTGYRDQAFAINDQIQKLKVPSSLLGFAEKYVTLYTTYVNYVDVYSKNLGSGGGFSDTDASIYDSDANIMSDLKVKINADIKTISNLIRS